MSSSGYKYLSDGGNGDVRENKCFGGEENYLVNRGCDATGGRHHANHIDKV